MASASTAGNRFFIIQSTFHHNQFFPLSQASVEEATPPCSCLISLCTPGAPLNAAKEPDVVLMKVGGSPRPKRKPLGSKGNTSPVSAPARPQLPGQDPRTKDSRQPCLSPPGSGRPRSSPVRCGAPGPPPASAPARPGEQGVPRAGLKRLGPPGRSPWPPSPQLFFLKKLHCCVSWGRACTPQPTNDTSCDKRQTQMKHRLGN